MTMIRGKVITEIELNPKENFVGEPLFVLNEKDVWVKKDGSTGCVVTKSLKELLESFVCKNKKQS